jgi:hypothetical protein
MLKLAPIFLAAFALPADDLSIQPFSVEWFNAPYENAVYESAEHSDGVFVLAAFQNACAPCDANEPNVEALAADYADTPRVQVLDLGLDADAADVQAWIARHSPAHPVVKDEEPYIYLELGWDKIPAVAVLDCMGRVGYTSIGVWNETVKKEVRGAVDALLGQACEHRR